MAKPFYTLMVLLLLAGASFSQNDPFLEKIRENDLLSYGGSDLLKYNGQTYLVGVSAVEVGKKRISQLTRIGKLKAERQITTFINGSDITSRTESYLKEVATTVNDSTAIETTDVFVEYIREDSEGFVKEMRPAGFWYSEDRAVFYYAIYKEVNL